MTSTNKTTDWELLMFSGINALLNHYQGFIFHKSREFVDLSRATLNQDDLLQEGRMAVVRCWKKQCESVSGVIKNFDMLVKWAIQNAFRTQTSREFNLKHGRHHLCMLSELVNEEQTNSVDGFEAVIHKHTGVDSMCYNGNTSGLCNLIEAVKQVLPDQKLKDTFEHIVRNEEFEYVNPATLPVKRRRLLAADMGIPDQELALRLESIQFIVQGYRDTFQQETWR